MLIGRLTQIARGGLEVSQMENSCLSFPRFSSTVCFLFSFFGVLLFSASQFLDCTRNVLWLWLPFLLVGKAFGPYWPAKSEDLL